MGDLMPATNPDRSSLEMFADSYLGFHGNYGNDKAGHILMF